MVVAMKVSLQGFVPIWRFVAGGGGFFEFCGFWRMNLLVAVEEKVLNERERESN